LDFTEKKVIIYQDKNIFDFFLHLKKKAIPQIQSFVWFEEVQSPCDLKFG